MSRTLEPQPLQFDAQGQPCSGLYGDRYASRDGAIAQARHVFLAGNGLPARWRARRHFSILETGFGLGNNFLATWQAWRDDPGRPRRLHFVSIERHPLPQEDLLALSRAPALAGEPQGLGALRLALAERWPLPLAGLHRIEFEDGGVILTLALGDALEIAPRLQMGVDAFYLDGFAPDRNPRMWDPRLIRALARLARPEATAATYTCARVVRDALGAHGFVVELAAGFGSKREMLRAIYRPAWKTRRHEPPAPYEGEERALVVGSGLAGSACAYALCRRGWQVTLLEQADAVAPRASALPAGLLHPLLSADDNLASRLSRAGFLYALGLLAGLEPPARNTADAGARRLWSPCGVFHQAHNAAQERTLRKAWAGVPPWPPAFARFLEVEQAASHLGLRPRHAGVWFASGAVVSSARWCRGLLQAATARPSGIGGPALDVVLGSRVERIERRGDSWLVRDAGGRCSSAPVLVLANAGGLPGLAPISVPQLQLIGGRISLLRAPALADLRGGISGDGYLIPPLLGAAAVGATYEFEAVPAAGAAAANAAAHEANRARLAQLVQEAPEAAEAGIFAAERCVSPDRLPLAGAVLDEEGGAAAGVRLRGARLPDLPRLPSLYCLAALGSRGLTLAPLLAEHVAASIGGEPAPVESDLAAAVDPARYWLRGRR